MRGTISIVYLIVIVIIISFYIYNYIYKYIYNYIYDSTYVILFDSICILWPEALNFEAPGYENSPGDIPKGRKGWPLRGTQGCLRLISKA